jgi:hypothetical protein
MLLGLGTGSRFTRIFGRRMQVRCMWSVQTCGAQQGGMDCMRFRNCGGRVGCRCVLVGRLLACSIVQSTDQPNVPQADPADTFGVGRLPAAGSVFVPAG